MIRPSAIHSVTGRHVIALGIRFGYWPCLRAPFVTLTLLRWHLDVWFGLPSNQPSPATRS